MILAEVRDYLSRRGRVPLSDLAARFEADPEALRSMLDTLIRKGRVRRLAAESGTCRGCCACGSAPAEVYEWVAGDSVRPAAPQQQAHCCG